MAQFERVDMTARTRESDLPLFFSRFPSLQEKLERYAI